MNQSALATIYRQWIWIGLPVVAIAAAAVAYCIYGVVTAIRKAHLFRVPLVEVQDVRFAEAGPVVLSVEGPRFTTRFAGVHFDLLDTDGRPVEGRRTLFRARTSGISTARMELVKYEIPGPGRYVLRIRGLGGVRENDSRHAIVFMRPHLGQSVAYILGIVFASMILIASLVFFLLRLREGY